MQIWLEGDSEIGCSMEHVTDSLGHPGAHFVGVFSQMPGMTEVELVDEGTDSVTIRTNEGLMTRTNLSITGDADSVLMELDEEYAAGSKVTATSHFAHRFTAGDTGITHHLVMGDVEASGFLGFFYSMFGSS